MELMELCRTRPLTPESDIYGELKLNPMPFITQRVHICKINVFQNYCNRENGITGNIK